MTEISLERVASALGYSEKPNPDTHRYANVTSVNPDGSYQVTFNGAVQSTRAVKLCDAEVGDRVLCVLHEGQVAAIGRVGGAIVPAVLFEDEGETGNLTLTKSAAGFEHMRIYFKKSNGQEAYSSIDVFQPDGKRVDMTVFEPYHTEQVTWFASRTVDISGTAITTYDYANGKLGSSPSGGNSNEVAITRVEAW